MFDILTRKDYLIGVASGVAVVYLFHGWKMRQAAKSSS